MSQFVTCGYCNGHKSTMEGLECPICGGYGSLEFTDDDIAECDY